MKLAYPSSSESKGDCFPFSSICTAFIQNMQIQKGKRKNIAVHGYNITSKAMVTSVTSQDYVLKVFSFAVYLKGAKSLE